MKSIILASVLFFSVQALGAESVMGVKFGTTIEKVRKTTKCRLSKDDMLDVKEKIKGINNYLCIWKNNPLKADLIRFDFHEGKLVLALSVFSKTINISLLRALIQKYGNINDKLEEIDKFDNNQIDEISIPFDNGTIELMYKRDERGVPLTSFTSISNDYNEIKEKANKVDVNDIW